MFVCCACCVLSGRGLCDELITRPEESYRLWCVVEQWRTQEFCSAGGVQQIHLRAEEKEKGDLGAVAP